MQSEQEDVKTSQTGLCRFLSVFGKCWDSAIWLQYACTMRVYQLKTLKYNYQKSV